MTHPSHPIRAGRVSDGAFFVPSLTRPARLILQSANHFFSSFDYCTNISYSELGVCPRHSSAARCVARAKKHHFGVHRCPGNPAPAAATTPAPAASPAASSANTSAPAPAPSRPPPPTRPAADSSRPTSPPAAPSTPPSASWTNLSTCSSAPPCSRPATTGPTAAPGGNAVSTNPPAGNLPVPTDSAEHVE